MNIREEISKMVFEMIGEREKTDLLENVDLQDEYMFDSLMIIELITNIEEKFAMEFDFDELDLDKIFNINHLVEVVEKCLR